RRTGSAGASLLAVKHREDAVGTAQTLHAVLARRDGVLCSQLIGDEPITELRIIGVDLASGIDEVCVVPVTLGEGLGPPPVEALRREPEHPAGHLDGDPV